MYLKKFSEIIREDLSESYQENIKDIVNHITSQIQTSAVVITALIETNEMHLGSLHLNLLNQQGRLILEDIFSLGRLKQLLIYV